MHLFLIYRICSNFCHYLIFAFFAISFKSQIIEYADIISCITCIFYKKHLKWQKIDWRKLNILHIFPIFTNFVTCKKFRYVCNDNTFCWFCRCLLNTKAAKVMKIIRDMFGLILQFRSLLVAADWMRDKTTGEMSHANFNQMLKCFQNFKQYSVFLFKGMNLRII